MCKVRLQQQEDGTYVAIVRKTRPDENPTRVLSGLSRENLAVELAKAVGEVKGVTYQQDPLFSP